MIKILFIFLFIFSPSAFAKEVKTLNIKARVKQVRMLEKNKFQIELFEYAAKYFSDEKISKCLFKATDEKKAVLLKVTAYQHQIVECEIKN